MKKAKLIRTAFAVCSAALIAAGCKSTPKKEEPTEIVEEKKEEPVKQEEVPEEDFSQANRELLAQVEESRRKAQDAGAPLSQVESWTATETEYAGAKAAVESNVKKDMSAELNALKDSYDKMTKDAYTAANQSLLAQVEASRAAALAAGADTRDPEAWKAAEEAYNALKSAVDSGSDEDLSKDLKELNDTYRTLAQNALAGANQTSLAQVEASRQEALDAGADELAPEAWAAAELEYGAQKKIVEAGSGDNLGLVLSDLDNRYKGLTAYAKASNAKEKIDSLDLAKYNQAEYDSATAILEELGSTVNIGGITVAKTGTGAEFRSKAESALASYQKVIKTAYQTMAKEERTNAFKNKQQADRVKAYVSRKDEYNKAVASYKNGELRRATDPEIAYESYKSASDTFAALYTEIAEARAATQARIDAAKQRVAESQATAVQADQDIPLSQAIDGIEDENAKLLEDDDFSADQAADVGSLEENVTGAPEK